jgi:stage II sporulation protein M
MQIWRFYRDLLLRNSLWLKRIVFWAASWLILGYLSFVLHPELLPRMQKLLKEIFQEILGKEELTIGLRSVILIFKNNLTAALISLFLGVLFGIAPLLSVALNFFVLGFLAAVFTTGHPFSHQVVGAGLFLASVVPHSILEIPALLLASAFGLKLGFSWKSFRSSLKQAFEILPLVAVLLFGAAVVEIFVTAKFVNFLVH